MANYTNTLIIVKGETRNDIDEFLKNGKTAEDGVSLIADSYYPISPDDVNERIRLWGTKCIWDFDVDRKSDTEVLLSTSTAWSAPVGYVEYVSKQFPTLSFELLCNEPGCGVNEWIVFHNGDSTDKVDDFIDELVSVFFGESYPFIEFEEGKAIDLSEPFTNFIKDGRFDVMQDPNENWNLFMEFLEEYDNEEDEED